MTFDEALEKLLKNSHYVPIDAGDYRNAFAISMADAQDILLDLRDTYAPTVEVSNHA